MAEGKISHSALCARFDASHKDKLCFGLGNWQGLYNGVWSEIPELVVRRNLHASMLEKLPMLTNSDVNSVFALLKARIHVDDARFDANPDLLAFDDGVLHISTGEFTEHSPDNYLTSKLPFPFDPAAQSSVWSDFLQQTVPDAADFLQEFAGYCLTTSTRYEVALWLHGPPGGGKSTFIEGLSAMLGHKACVLGLSDIETSHFGLINLPGKTLAISTEQPAMFMKSAHILNALISGEPINVDRKYHDMITVIPRCKIIWAMNELPRIDERGVGLFRRVKLIHFPAIPADQRDPKVKEAIAASGMAITNWALAGLARLQQRGCFEIPAALEEATENYRVSNDVTQLFVNDCCMPGLPSDQVQSSILYSVYFKWCNQNGHRPMSSTRFSDELIRLGLTKLKASVVFWCGIRLKNEGLVDASDADAALEEYSKS